MWFLAYLPTQLLAFNMKLANVARYYDKEVVTDAYTGAFLFKGQMLSPAEHVSGDTFRRHTLTTTDLVSAPTRRVVTVLGEPWIMGYNNPDGFKGKVMRRNHSLKKATNLLNLLTPSEACLGSTGTLFYGCMEFLREAYNLNSQADMSPFWDIYCPINETIRLGSFLRNGTTILRVKTLYALVEGFIDVEADEFNADAVQSAIFVSNGTYDPLTDSMQSSSVHVPVIQTDSQKYYQFKTEAEDGLKPGDRIVFAPQSVITPKVGGNLTMIGKRWRVLSVASEIDAWALHVRLA